MRALQARVHEILEAAGIEPAQREAEWLIEATTGFSRTDLSRKPALSDEVEQRTLALAQRRAAGEPLQYLTGAAGFRYLDVAVGPGVLVPRPETEIVAGRAMELLPEGGTVVDVGTGSGAIALAIADERPDATVIATESSPEAMAWAVRNRTALNKDVHLVAGDLLSGLDKDLRRHIDVVVSNPPYVATWEENLLPRDVVEHEPHEALFAGEDGLSVIRRLATDSLEWLRPGGGVVVEIGERQGSAVMALLHDLGYQEVAIEKDLVGRDRIATAVTGA